MRDTEHYLPVSAVGYSLMASCYGLKLNSYKDVIISWATAQEPATQNFFEIMSSEYK